VDQRENTGKENRMLNWVRAGYGLETSVIVGMSSDQFYEGKPRYAKRKLKYSLNQHFNLLPYVEWDRFVTLTGAQAE
jgi:hypothetical protein